MRTALVSAFYPGVEPFLKEWSASVRSQRDRAFDVCVILDQISPADAAAATGLADAEWISVSGDAGIGAARNQGLQALVDRYDVLVSVDADDVLEPDRVGEAKARITAADVVVTSMSLIDADGGATGSVMRMPIDPDWMALLSRCNVAGMSNTAWRSSVLSDCLPIPPRTSLVDWFLATRAAANGARIGTDPGLRMRYRQHGANIARVVPPFTAEQLRAAVTLVLRHCDDVLPLLPAAWRTALHARRASVAMFSETIADDRACAVYLDHLNRLPAPHFWWEPVAHPELSALWTR